MNKNRDAAFLKEIGQIKAPEIFLGVARILKVPLLSEDKEARDFIDLFADIMEKYHAAPRKRRKELLQILRDANRAADPIKSAEVDAADGNRTEAS